MVRVMVARTMGGPRSARKAYPHEKRMVSTVSVSSPMGNLRRSQKKCESQDSDVYARHNEDVIRPGALKVGFQFAAEEGASANQHGLHQRSGLTRPQALDVIEHAATGVAA